MTVAARKPAASRVVRPSRSSAAAATLASAGAEVTVGSLEDAESLCAGAASADGVIHT
jgi:uncharacterized protein YbjT (DUF2867 family)